MSIAIGGGQAAAPIPVGTPSDLRAPRLRRGLLAVALPAGAGWAVAYMAAGAAASAGPVLIWGMVHLGLGALLLHAGLFAALVLLWRDPAVAAELGAMVAERRRTLASR